MNDICSCICSVEFPSEKKIGFNSSEMAKKCVSVSHKVERSFIYFVHYSL